MIREAIDAVVSGQCLSMEEATIVMREIMEGVATPAQLGAYLTALSIKGETPEEIAGMATVMREKALRVKRFMARDVADKGDKKQKCS